MSDGHEQLIETLSRRLRPVRVLWPPWLRAACWLALCALLGAAIVWLGRPAAAVTMTMPDHLALAGAAATALTAALAAFSLAVPGRTPLWAALPLLPLTLWVAASAWSCGSLAPGSVDWAAEPTPLSCFRFIVLFSVPVTTAIYVMLRQAFCTRLTLTAMLAGLAAASVGTVALELWHPHAMPLSDFVSHFGAVAVVVLACRLALPPLLRPR